MIFQGIHGPQHCPLAVRCKEVIIICSCNAVEVKIQLTKKCRQSATGKLKTIEWPGSSSNLCHGEALDNDLDHMKWAPSRDKIMN